MHPGVETGLDHLVIQVTFWPGQTGVTQFIKYLAMTQILHWIICINMMSGTDQNNELSVLDSDDESVSPESPQDIWRD